ncbi:hypothetical protein [Oceanithermus desulfurans]|uniref:Uncharacterized protein n=2 Tax=Oceanithermus desulfurans TaxID=227924 RepID=A0A511RK12_9DEIN|nr:hypothetical protein [Oceanithermus desulfurans]MBB6029356.1 hypothetical protein [Oceanithermus desulfurans]GEM89988.1 hypothetical protein ODE01S_14220 [Oceanithermus desulfurans NBRC 100063]
MRRLWLELTLTPLPLAALVAGLLAALWINPYTLYLSGASGPLAVRLLDVVAFVVGAMLGAQLLTPEEQGRTHEVVAARPSGVSGVLLYRIALVLGAWLVASYWMAALLLWSDPGRNAVLLTLTFFASGAAGLALALAVLARTGSPTLAMSAGALVLGVFLALRAGGLATGALELFPAYAFYPDGLLLRSKALWLLVAALLAAYAVAAVHRPVAFMNGD